MISGWELYWITRLSALKGVLGVALCIGGFVWVIFTSLVMLDDDINLNEWGKKWYKLWTLSLVLVLMTLWLVPTTEEMFAIKVLPEIVNNEKVQHIPQKALDYVDKWLESQLEELRK